MRSLEKWRQEEGIDRMVGAGHSGVDEGPGGVQSCSFLPPAARLD